MRIIKLKKILFLNIKSKLFLLKYLIIIYYLFKFITIKSSFQNYLNNYY